MSKDQQPDPKEKDFYLENGFVVFTQAYHLKRGYCCKNGCRHCPYGNSPKDNKEEKKKKG